MLSRYDVDTVRLNGSLFADLKRWQQCNKDSTLFILHENHKPDLDFSSPIDSKKLQPAIDRCRVIKDTYEIERIRSANDISASAHRAVLRHIRQFKNESQIQGIFQDVCTSHQTKKQAYTIIAGSGENAGVLHYTKNDEPLAGRQLVCLDAGAEWENYASDVTRTFPISGNWPSEEAKAIYNLVRDIQDSCIEKLKPGAFMIDLHTHTHKLVIRGLLKLGILKGSPDEIYEAGTSKGFYPHGLGHHLGLDVHDTLGVPILKYRTEDCPPVLNLATALAPCRPEQPPLEEGMVITIEPGIYFSRYELERAYLSSPIHSKFIDKDVLDKYWAVGGVRIEDNLLITENGHENLTTAPKGEEALELIRQGVECNRWGFWNGNYVLDLGSCAFSAPRDALGYSI